ncbi:DUF1178 family protein [Roseovarius salis]|uniref:DUF1178 family protein n=1 Tax=Roseovarius salis TaxID=3376063 RepID=UPI0037CA3C15
MIQFTLKCDRDHRFDSWFQSAGAFDTLKASGMVACAVCGSTQVDKALMAPRVHSRDAERPAPDTPEDGNGGAASGTPLSTPSSPAAQALSELKRRIEQHSDYVGQNFAREARDMHEGLTPERPIHGEARAEEARKLIEEGVPVTPLPFLPGRKTN